VSAALAVADTRVSVIAESIDDHTGRLAGTRHHIARWHQLAVGALRRPARPWRSAAQRQRRTDATVIRSRDEVDAFTAVDARAQFTRRPRMPHLWSVTTCSAPAILHCRFPTSLGWQKWAKILLLLFFLSHAC